MATAAEGSHSSPSAEQNVTGAADGNHSQTEETSHQGQNVPPDAKVKSPSKTTLTDRERARSARPFKVPGFWTCFVSFGPSLEECYRQWARIHKARKARENAAQNADVEKESDESEGRHMLPDNSKRPSDKPKAMSRPRSSSRPGSSGPLIHIREFWECPINTGPSLDQHQELMHKVAKILHDHVQEQAGAAAKEDPDGILNNPGIAVGMSWNQQVRDPDNRPGVSLPSPPSQLRQPQDIRTAAVTGRDQRHSTSASSPSDTRVASQLQRSARAPGQKDWGSLSDEDESLEGRSSRVKFGETMIQLFSGDEPPCQVGFGLGRSLTIKSKPPKSILKKTTHATQPSVLPKKSTEFVFPRVTSQRYVQTKLAAMAPRRGIRTPRLRASEARADRGWEDGDMSASKAYFHQRRSMHDKMPRLKPFR
eukprot:scpid38894/ scgid17108/ 